MPPVLSPVKQKKAFREVKTNGVFFSTPGMRVNFLPVSYLFTVLFVERRRVGFISVRAGVLSNMASKD